MLHKLNRLLRLLLWTLTILCILSACVICVVSIDEMVSRNETEWTDGGFSHVSEMESEKTSEED